MQVNGYTIGPNANLQEADLRDADLRGANLRGANLQEADLRGANLQDANLRGADLRGANLRGADLRGANLQDADLQYTNLRGTYFQDANLQGANLRGANLIHPESVIVPAGDLIVYKKLREGMCTLLIPKEAQRVNATGRKCRAEFAVVKSLPTDVSVGHSKHDPNFRYEVGQTVRPTKPFDTNRWNECSSGIHFFITLEEAEAY